jgi:hypothetical protein
MTDGEAILEPYQSFEARIEELLAKMPDIEPPPGGFIELSEVPEMFRSHFGFQMATRESAVLDAVMKSLLSVAPTAAELAAADKTLRTRVLPETSDEELAEAVAGIASDPEKVELAALLTKAVEQATGVPGSTPWVVFLLVFCWALKADPNAVGALGLAFAVMAMMQDKKKGK